MNPMAEPPEVPLSREAIVFRHLRHQHHEGVPLAAWEMADQATGCPVQGGVGADRAGPEFLAWLGTRDGEHYVEELHAAAHQVDVLPHDVSAVE